jgi:hypothetical protein
VPIKKYPNRTSDRIVGPEIVSSVKGGVQVAARHQVNKQCSFYAFMPNLGSHLLMWAACSFNTPHSKMKRSCIISCCSWDLGMQY